MAEKFGRDFYQIQRSQWRKSLFLFSILILLYLCLIGIFMFGIALLLEFVFNGSFSLSTDTIIKIFLMDIAFALVIALFHLYDARKYGAKFIRNRLEAISPSPDDFYHKKYINTVEEIRIACGLPKINPYILPSFAVNSMALIEADGTPSAFVTEGLLAEFSRNELQAVIAHEIAHIVRGDAFYMTLVCSLANFFERARQVLEPDIYRMDTNNQAQPIRGGIFQADLFLKFSTIVMHLLSALISRQREILADATAVEICRNPRALAQAIYKAHIKNSFIGDFNLTYSPLFIVPPESDRISEGFFNRLFNSHPPLLMRIEMLSSMISTAPSDIIEEVTSLSRIKDKARQIVPAQEDRHKINIVKTEEEPEISGEDGRVWKIRSPRGKHEGPYTIEELLSVGYFTPLIQVKNIQEGVEAPAREFPQIRTAILSMGRKKPINPSKHNLCSRCRKYLRERIYEGVGIKECPDCRGKLVDASHVGRIIARKEFGFSSELKDKAEEFRRDFLLNPFGFPKIRLQRPNKTFCPICTKRMLARPFNYCYVLPVDKCLSCGVIWFDSDELEMLQILIEDR
ncbi:MAG: M48 family metalloprotease [Candidatus Aminicenantes bacterium]|nr:M48 family metalloprotease [Candidatus Aminicenantes bacterium]